jgi:hypothetical protein
MTTVVKRRGGTTTEHETFVGASREITVDTEKKTVVVHDGITPGGFPLAREDLSNVSHQAFFYGIRFDENDHLIIDHGEENYNAKDFIDWLIVGMAMSFSVNENGHVIMEF